MNCIPNPSILGRERGKERGETFKYHFWPRLVRDLPQRIFTVQHFWFSRVLTVVFNLVESEL